MPFRALLVVLSLLAALALAVPAGAVVNNPDGTVNKDGRGGEAEPALPTAGQVKDAAKAAEARENAASKSIEEMLSKASNPNQPGQTGQPGQTVQPVSGGKGQPASGRKAIYGDIIIHK